MSCRCRRRVYGEEVALTNSYVGPVDALLARLSLDTHDEEEVGDDGERERKWTGGRRKEKDGKWGEREKSLGCWPEKGTAGVQNEPN